MKVITLALLAAACHGAVGAAPVPVKVREDGEGRFTLLRDGKPYVIKGAGGTTHLDLLKACGGNSVRTWGVDSLAEKVGGKPLLDRCDELGLTVTAGLWIGHERHGFDYANEAQVRKQRDAVRAAVRKYKDHPALLAWGLGNEMEGPTADGSKADHIWKELNVLAAIVKEEDTNHPVMTVIAGTAKAKIRGVLAHAPNIDILGVNAYSAAVKAPEAIREAEWAKPFVLSEFGPAGHWEVPKTKWGAPIEPTGRAKAAKYLAAQTAVMEKGAGACLGSYCFVWGQKQEATATWYGMFLKTGEKLPPVDAMCKAWSGKDPANRCPAIKGLASELKGAVVPPGKEFAATAEATDPEGDALTWDWAVTAEAAAPKGGGDKEAVPPSFPDAVVSADKDRAVIKAPDKPGNYRVFVVVRDGKGGASVENFCFRVERP